MIDLTYLYIQKAVRLSEYDLDATLATAQIFPGQLYQLNAASKWVVADGTKRAYPTLSSRYPGTGLGPQGELLEGRDDVSRVNKLACLKGNFEMYTDQYDHTKTFISGAALYPSITAPGKLTPFDSTNVAHLPQFICGFVTKVPASGTDTLGYEH